ncbi:MAG: RHS repeat-associated core domain-containing protein [Chloroflexota bacterium]|nr:RHS repeat-associated core domain-containing protein [Chloroflexota bacterium]
MGSTSVTSGATSSTQTYYAFGAVRTTSGTLPTDYTFTGQKFDADAALMYYGARYYDATIGRFLQPDSIIPNQFNPQSLNRYAYVRNNPVRYTDPTGQTCRFGREDCEALGGQQNPASPATTGNEQKPSEGGDGAKTTTIGPDPNQRVFYMRHTFAWTQAIFECYEGFCVTATSIDYGDMVMDITIGTGKGAMIGGEVESMQFYPTRQTLKAMELGVTFLLQDSRNRTSRSQLYVLGGDTVFNFYQNSKDIPKARIVNIDTPPIVDVPGGLPSKIYFSGAKKPPYEFSFGLTKGIDSFAWTVP